MYSGPSDKDNVDEQVNILDEELSRYPAALAILLQTPKHAKCSSIKPVGMGHQL